MFPFKLFLLTGLTIIKGQQIGIEECGNTVGCIKVGGASCTSFETCTAVGMYFFNATTNLYHFDLYFTKKWAAFGQNTLNKNGTRMNGLRGFYCISPDTSSTVNLHLMRGDGIGKPTRTSAADVPEITDLTTSVINGVSMCSFKRPMTIDSASGRNTLYDLDIQNLINIVAFGDNLNGDEISYHGRDNYQINDGAPILDWTLFTLPTNTAGNDSVFTSVLDSVMSTSIVPSMVLNLTMETSSMTTNMFLSASVNMTKAKSTAMSVMSTMPFNDVQSSTDSIKPTTSGQKVAELSTTFMSDSFVSVSVNNDGDKMMTSTMMADIAPSSSNQQQAATSSTIDTVKTTKSTEKVNLNNGQTLTASTYLLSMATLSLIVLLVCQ